MLTDILAALGSTRYKTFMEGYRKARCIRTGHKHPGSTLIERIRSENHPDSNWERVFTLNIRRCSCGSVYHEAAMEWRAEIQHVRGPKLKAVL